MCRFLVYKGSDDILLSKLILDPCHSILTQSFDSRLRLDLRRPHNADGFGIGYYTDPKLGTEPCIFTSTLPAWNCSNLQRIASKTASSLIFAHVRATTEGSLSEDNCHPFCHGSLMWMHNGGLGGWKYIKRRLMDRIADKWFHSVHGGTDSEWAFALFLNSLELMGYNPNITPESGFGPNVLRMAMLKTIRQINDFIADIPESTVIEEKVDTRSLLNFALTDGHSVVCSRYVSSRTDEAASMYYSSGTTWDDKQKGNFQMDRKDKGADIVLVASEPLTFERDNWVTVPTNSTLTIHKQTVMIHPIIDEYYSTDPYHSRSSKFVARKGLVSSAKGSTPSAEIPMPLPDLLQKVSSLFPNKSSLRHVEPSLLQDDQCSLSQREPNLNKLLPSSKYQDGYFNTLNPERHFPSVPSSSESLHSKTFSETNNALMDISSVTPLPSQSTPYSQKQGNTKKKISMGSVNKTNSTFLPSPEEVVPEWPRTPEERTYGDPAKIAKLFPELNLGR